MSTSLNKSELIQRLKDVFGEFRNYCAEIPGEKFFETRSEKWSIAETMQHLILSVNATTPAFRLPKFILRLAAGKSNRPSRTYQALVDSYKSKLEAGGKAPSRFIPKRLSESTGKQAILEKWDHSTERFLATFQENRTEQNLDEYIVPHPLLGKVTLRELAYFTIYHTEHHHNIIKTGYIQKNTQDLR